MSVGPAGRRGSRAPCSTAGVSGWSATARTGCIRGGMRARPGRPVQLAPETERLLLSVAVSAATWGASRIAAYLRHRWQLRVAPSTVQRALRRAGLATRRQRLTVLEHRALQTAGLLTERTRSALWQAQHGQPRHVAAREPGELVCAGHLLHRAAQRRGQGLADHGLRRRVLLRRRVVAARPQRRGGRPLPASHLGARCIAGRAGGCAACSPTAAPSSRGRSMTPAGRSASATPGRSRGTPGRTGSSSGCKARSCRSIGAWPSVGATSPVGRRSNEASMAFMQSYNHERPHQGYRVRGRTPAALFWGAARA